MANEIQISSIGNQVESEILSGLFLLALADRNALPAHPALFRVPSIGGRGSTTQKIPQIGLLGYDILASTAEIASVANSALVDAAGTIATARYSKAYEASDLARMVDAHGVLNPTFMALDALISVNATLLDLIANLVDNFTGVTGTSGVNASVANFLDQITALEINRVEGPYLGIYHPIQWGDIRSDVAINSGGSIQWNPGSQRILDAMKGLGSKGKYLDVDIFTSTRVPTANAAADRAGGMFGRGALAWTMSPPPVDPDLPQLVIGDAVLFEKARTARTALTAHVSHAYLGASEQIDACGNSLITDA